MSDNPPYSVADVRDAIDLGLQEFGGPRSLELLTELVVASAPHLKEHLELEHTIPSPSGVTACRLEQWFYARGFAPDSLRPAQWRRQAMLGVMSELWWTCILQLGGLPLTVPTAALQVGEHMRGWPDALLVGCPVEYKLIGGWEYKRIMEGYGIYQSKPDHYAQLQLYAYGAQAEWGLYLASPMDPRFLEKVMQQRKKYGKFYELRWTYVEWVRTDRAYQEGLLERAAMIAQDALSEQDPPRENSGITHDLMGEPRWPCGYCPFAKECQARQGVGRY